MLLVELGEAAMRLEELVRIANEGREVVLVKNQQPMAKLVRYTGSSNTNGKGLLAMLKKGPATQQAEPKPVE